VFFVSKTNLFTILAIRNLKKRTTNSRSRAFAAVCSGSQWFAAVRSGSPPFAVVRRRSLMIKNFKKKAYLLAK
jgi:hypothetical protein